MRRLRTLVLLLLATSATQAVALEYDWNDTHFTLNNRYTFGAAIRMQERDYRLIGKTNVPGQQDLCSKDSCISLTGDPEPNQRRVDARRAEGRRVGKECVWTCRSRWAPDHKKKQQTQK